MSVSIVGEGVDKGVCEHARINRCVHHGPRCLRCEHLRVRWIQLISLGWVAVLPGQFCIYVEPVVGDQYKVRFNTVERKDLFNTFWEAQAAGLELAEEVLLDAAESLQCAAVAPR